MLLIWYSAYEGNISSISTFNRRYASISSGNFINNSLDSCQDAKPSLGKETSGCGFSISIVCIWGVWLCRSISTRVIEWE